MSYLSTRYVWAIALLATACVSAVEDGNDDLAALADVQTWELETADCGHMASGARLERGTSVTSCDGSTKLSVEPNGALTVRKGSAVLFTTGGPYGPYGTIYDGRTLALQDDGNLVFWSKICTTRDTELVQGVLRCKARIPLSVRWSLSGQLQRTGSRLIDPAGASVRVDDAGSLSLIGTNGALLWQGIPKL